LGGGDVDDAHELISQVLLIEAALYKKAAASVSTIFAVRIFSIIRISVYRESQLRKITWKGTHFRPASQA
jgi:hypothetical protein